MPNTASNILFFILKNCIFVSFKNTRLFLLVMKAVIVNFRLARNHQYDNQMILKVEGVESRDKASKLVGKKVVWTSPANKEIAGEVRSAHGNKGALRALFETGMPGQAIGSVVALK